MCRDCRSDYKRQHYFDNRDRYVSQAADRKRRVRLERTKLLLAYFLEHPCVDCDETDPLVLEFDHLGDKKFEIGSGLSYRRWEDVLAEIEKCEVVCANCHRRRTARRRCSVRVLLTTDPSSEERS